MFSIRKLSVAFATFALGASPVLAASPTDWEAFAIRQAGGALMPVVPVQTATNAVSVLIDEGNEKAGFGTDYFNGMQLKDVWEVHYTRNDPGVGEIYSNIWVSDGTHYAVIAPAIGMNSTGNYTGGSNINGVNIQPLGFNIHEYLVGDGFDWLVPGAKRVNSALLNADNSVITVADIGHLIVADPNPGIAQGGGGAPKNGTGFNLIFGDTANNHTNGVVPYSISDVTAVPEPASAGVVGIAVSLLALGRRRRLQA